MDLEVVLGKTKVTMKKVVVAGIDLNVISCYALMEQGWKSTLGGANDSFLEYGKLKFPLTLSERSWWLTVSIPKKTNVNRQKPVPMDCSNVKTAETESTEGTVSQAEGAVAEVAVAITKVENRGSAPKSASGAQTKVSPQAKEGLWEASDSWQSQKVEKR